VRCSKGTKLNYFGLNIGGVRCSMGRTLNYFGLNMGPITEISVINSFTEAMKAMHRLF
jgi:hypothetical protein